MHGHVIVHSIETKREEGVVRFNMRTVSCITHNSFILPHKFLIVVVVFVVTSIMPSISMVAVAAFDQ